VDVLAIGASVSQTKNLEDGTGPGAKALYLGGVLTYRWSEDRHPAHHRRGFNSISFDGPAPATSMRGTPAPAKRHPELLRGLGRRGVRAVARAPPRVHRSLRRGRELVEIELRQRQADQLRLARLGPATPLELATLASSSSMSRVYIEMQITL